jgi:hypothetical protein
MDMPQLLGHRELVKNADDNWPTASRPFSEVIAARPDQNRENPRESPTVYSLAECTEND